MTQTKHKWRAWDDRVDAPNGATAVTLRECLNCKVVEARGFRPRGGEGRWANKTGWVKLWLTVDGDELRYRPECFTAATGAAPSPRAP